MTPMNYHKWLLKEIGDKAANKHPAALELSLVWCRMVSLANSTDEMKSVGECVLEQVFGDTETLEKWPAAHINTTMEQSLCSPTPASDSKQHTLASAKLSAA